MTRTVLPHRRVSTTMFVKHVGNDGNEHEFLVTFGFGREAPLKVREVFCGSPKVGSDMQAFINDSCIAISLLLQHGMTMSELASAFGENRPEGSSSGPPSSPLGSIAKKAVEIERGLLDA
jgi:hypothetical protein